MPFPFVAAAMLGSSAISAIGSRFANKANRDQVNQANQFSARQADINRGFQEKMFDRAQAYDTQMSNTSWQRGVADMKAAGVNPMLAVSQGGASSPVMSGSSGNSAQGIAASNQQNELANFANSAKDALITDKQLDVMEEQKEMYRQQGNAAGQQANNLMVRTNIDVPKIDASKAQAAADTSRALINAKIDSSDFGVPLEVAKRLNIDLASATQAYKIFKGSYKTGERTEGHTGVTTTYKERVK